MEIAVIVAVFFAIAAAALVFVVVRRLVKWAFRLALLAALAVAVLIGAVVIWWYGTSVEEQPTRRPAATRGSAR